MVYLFQRIITHYQLPVYKKLNELLKNELVFICGQQVREGYFFDVSEDKLPFRTVKVKNFWFNGETAVWQNFLVPFKKYKRPDVVIMEQSPRILSLFPLFLYCRWKNIPFILWGHGGSRRRSVSESDNVKDMMHRWLIRKADAFICYTDGIKDELSKITEKQKLFVARNTLDTETLFSIRSKLEKEGRETVKNKLGLKRKNYICFIGRLLEDKQVDYLIDVYELIKKRIADSGLLLIGDGPERNYIEGYVSKNGLKDVYFLGGIDDWEQSGQYLYVSDVMVMPGYVGLSVNHAFCFGLPVITQAGDKNGPFHSPEIEYIIDGETGFICQKGNKEEMTQAITKVFDNKSFFNEKVTTFCKNKLSIDAMVYAIKEAVDFAVCQRQN